MFNLARGYIVLPDKCFRCKSVAIGKSASAGDLGYCSQNYNSQCPTVWYFLGVTKLMSFFILLLYNYIYINILLLYYIILYINI